MPIATTALTPMIVTPCSSISSAPGLANAGPTGVSVRSNSVLAASHTIGSAPPIATASPQRRTHK